MNDKKLYGDGVNDDYPAIQALLDSGAVEVSLPAPAKNYQISKTLKIHGGQTLRLPRFAVIKLCGGADQAMLEDDDFSTWKENICVCGGIWDMNNAAQSPNPWHFADENGVTSHDRLAALGLKFPTPEAYGIRRVLFGKHYAVLPNKRAYNKGLDA